jgi:hypothetical protein
MDSWTNFRAVDVDRLAALCLARRRSLEEGSLRATCALLRTFSRPSLTKSELGKLEQRKARIARLKELDAPEVVVAHEERALDPYAYFSALANRTDLDASEVAAHAKDSLSMSFPFEYALGGGASDDEIVEWVLLPFDRRLWGFNDPEPEVVPALPQSIVGWPPEKARAVYYGQAVLSVDGEVPFPPTRYGESGLEERSDQPNFTPPDQVATSLSFFRAVREGPRPSLDEWKQSFAFIPRFQMYALVPGYPDNLLRDAERWRVQRLNAAYRRLGGLIRFYERCQRRGFGVLFDQGAA